MDRARTATSAGSDIPVPRTADFVNMAVNLLNVPVNPAERVMLRVYDPDDAGPAAAVDIRIYAMDGTALHAHVQQFTSSGYPHWEGQPFAPGYIELPIEPAITATTDRVRIEVRPIGESLRIWAFVTSTNNASHHVTVIAP
jgi:hypothetical protein